MQKVTIGLYPQPRKALKYRAFFTRQYNLYRDVLIGLVTTLFIAGLSGQAFAQGRAKIRAVPPGLSVAQTTYQGMTILCAQSARKKANYVPALMTQAKRVVYRTKNQSRRFRTPYNVHRKLCRQNIRDHEGPSVTATVTPPVQPTIAPPDMTPSAPGEATPTPLPAILDIDKEGLYFEVGVSRIELTIRNLGGVPLQVSVNTSAEWLQSSQSTATIEQEARIAFEVDRSVLSPGFIVGTIEIHSNAGNKVIDVLVVVLPPPAELSISSSALNIPVSENFASLNVQTSTAGCADFAISDPPSWLEVYPRVGRTCGEVVPITFFANRCFGDDLVTHSANLTVVNNGTGNFQIIQVTVQSISGASDLEWIQTLATLPRLNKVHVSWPAPSEQLVERPSDPLINSKLYHFIRIAGGIGISSAQSDSTLDLVLRVVQLVTQNENFIPVIAVNYSPFPWDIFSNLTPLIPIDSPEVQNEFSQMESRFENIKEFVHNFNISHGSSLVIHEVLLDSETWKARSGSSAADMEWNAALEEKLNSVYGIAKDVFGSETGVTYYRHGDAPYTTMNVSSDRFSFSNYHLIRPSYVDARFRSFLQRLHDHGDTTPAIETWISLGQGYLEAPQNKLLYSCDLAYPANTSALYGSLLNQPVPNLPLLSPVTEAQWERSSTVVFYPHPFSRNTRDSLNHFVRYVQGDPDPQ